MATDDVDHGRGDPSAQGFVSQGSQAKVVAIALMLTAATLAGEC
ncbi:MAG: hypothetical protein WBG32_22415 [Nodosilinea sp.]